MAWRLLLPRYSNAMPEESTTSDLAERVRELFVAANGGSLCAVIVFLVAGAVYGNSPYGLRTYVGSAKIAGVKEAR